MLSNQAQQNSISTKALSEEVLYYLLCTLLSLDSFMTPRLSGSGYPKALLKLAAIVSPAVYFKNRKNAAASPRPQTPRGIEASKLGEDGS
jgi:hypothetical protein